MLLELGKRGFAVGSDREFEKFRGYTQALYKRMLAIASYAVPSPSNLGRRGRILAKSQHPVRDILIGVAGGAYGGSEN